MQYAIYAMPGRRREGYVVNVQADLLNEIWTRVVIPLVPASDAPRNLLGTLNPVLAVLGKPHVLLTQNLASVPTPELGPPIGSLVSDRDAIVRAIDTLLSGV